MLRMLVKAVLILVLVVGVAAFFIGWQLGEPDFDRNDDVVGTSGVLDDRDVDRDGRDEVNIDTARDVGAEVGGAIATGAAEAGRLLDGAATTARIKSKMALDDTLQARYIDVDTTGSVVTLTGTVESEAQRERALQLARETEGVTSVVDQLRLR